MEKENKMYFKQTETYLPELAEISKWQKPACHAYQN